MSDIKTAPNLSLSVIRERVGQTGGFSDEAMHGMINEAVSFLSGLCPSAPMNDALFNGAVMDLIKNSIAYEGYQRFGVRGLNTTYVDKREEIAERYMSIIGYRLNAEEFIKNEGNI